MEGERASYVRERALVVALWIAYAAIFLLLGARLGPGVSALGIVPVAVTGYLLGVRPGLIAGIAVAVLHTVLLNVLGHPGPDVLLREGGGPGSAAIVAAGVALGAIHDLEQKTRALTETLRSQHQALREAHGALDRELRQRSEYVASIARELTNPLSAIRNAAEVLRSGRPIDVGSAAEGIAHEAQLALALVQGLDTAAAIESRRSVLRKEPLELDGIVRNTIARFDPGEHPLRVDVASGVRVVGDRDAIAAILRHLLGNAAKYAPARTAIEVRARTGGGIAEIAVRDHGPGVPEDERPRLFQRFTRLSTAGGTSGAGLGLYICDVVARELGGSMRFTAPPDGGAEFALRLPASAPTGTQPA